MPEPRSSESSKPPLPPSWPEWKDWIRKRGWWLTPLARTEWASEWVYYGLRRLAFFDLLELAGRAAVLVAVVLWFLEAGDRAKERHYRAWDLVNSARGSTGDGGRKDALQDLNQDGVSLAAAPLENAYLPGVDLKGAFLWDAHLQGAHLQGAHLQGAVLWGANLQGAVLLAANLQGADFLGANLSGARSLSQEQLNAAMGDYRTQLPEGLTRPAHWTKAPDTPPAAQPDAAERPPSPAGAPGSDK